MGNSFRVVFIEADNFNSLQELQYRANDQFLGISEHSFCMGGIGEDLAVLCLNSDLIGTGSVFLRSISSLVCRYCGGRSIDNRSVVPEEERRGREGEQPWNDSDERSVVHSYLSGSGTGRQHFHFIFGFGVQGIVTARLSSPFSVAEGKSMGSQPR